MKISQLAPILALTLLASSCTLFADDTEVSDTTDGTDGSGGKTDSPGGSDQRDSDAGAEIPSFVDPDPDPTPIESDLDLVTGTLDNGLEYFILENDSPGQRAEMRLVVNAGSAQQKVADSGNAHFLEHMLFNGTADYPGNELNEALRGLGMEIGPDINAYTSFDETVYELSLPSARPDTIATGLHILEQWGAEALLDPTEVENERGVVREERRLRTESADGIINARFTEIYLTNSDYENTDPIGTEENILATESAELRQFYDDWYRPDNMAVVVVGDFRAESVEEKLIAEMASLTNRGSSPERVVAESGQIPDAVAEVLAHPDGPEPAISLDYQIPVWDESTVGGARLGIAEEVVGVMLQAYLDEAASAGTLDLVRPFAGPFSINRGRRFLGLNVTSANLENAPSEVLRGVYSAQVTGFTQEQMDAGIDEMRAGFDQFLAGDESRQDGDWADLLANDFLAGLPNMSSQATYDLGAGVLDGLTLDELNNLFRWELSDSVPLLVALGPDADDLPSQTVLEEALSGATSGAALDRTEVVEIDQLMDRPESEDPSSTGTVPGGTDATWWTFENGMTVIYQFSNIDSGQVQVWGISHGGTRGLDDDQARLADTAFSAVLASGVGEYDQVSLDRYLAGSSASFQLFSDSSFDVFVGQSEAPDLEDVFQLVSLYASEARVDPVGVAEAIDESSGLIRYAETDAATAAYYSTLATRYDNDPAFVALPTEDDLDAATPESLLEIFNARFGGFDDLTILVVGDVGVADVEDLVNAYVPALPRRDADPDFGDPPPLPPLPVTLSVTAGTDDSGAGFDLNYWTIGDLDRSEAVAGDYLTSIINGKLFDRVREELGASYGGGNASINTGFFGGGETVLTVSVDGDPARLDEIRAVVDEELARLAADGPTSGDFAEARSIVTSDAELVSNADILFSLAEWSEDRQRSAYIRRDYARDADRVTASKVQALAAKLISDANLIEVTRTPAN